MTNSSASASKVFPLVVQQTYFDQGFFNVTVDFDGCVRRVAGSVRLLLGAERRLVEARVDRSANQNRAARVMGGVELRDWFQRNCQPMQTVYMDLSSPTQIHITLEQPIRQ